jgi:hypothetical protein
MDSKQAENELSEIYTGLIGTKHRFFSQLWKSVRENLKFGNLETRGG